MHLLVSSAPDEASVNIRDRLLEIGGWAESGAFDGSPVWRRGDLLLVSIREHHLFVDHLDAKVRDALAVEPEAIVYLSKHRAESGRNSLTVHMLGNWREAEYGGRPGQVVPTAPNLMTQTLRHVAAGAKDLPFTVSFEATHHGPYLETPTFFVEIGSGPERWGDHRAAEVLAKAVLATSDPGYRVGLGVGGGHYMPRITDVALSRRVAFGHLVPSYALEPPNFEVITQAIERTPGASFVYFHRKAIDKPRLRELEAFFRDRGLEVVREADLEPLPGSSPESL